MEVLTDLISMNDTRSRIIQAESRISMRTLGTVSFLALVLFLPSLARTVEAAVTLLSFTVSAVTRFALSPTAARIPTSEPMTMSAPGPASTPSSAPTATLIRMPITSLPTSTPATLEISSPTSTATATKTATVTLSPMPSPTNSPTSRPLTPTDTAQPPTATVTPTALGIPRRTATVTPTVLSLEPRRTGTPTALNLPRKTLTQTATPGPWPISRRTAGLGHLWFVGILFIAVGVGLAWLAYSLIRRRHD